MFFYLHSTVYVWVIPAFLPSITLCACLSVMYKNSGKDFGDEDSSDLSGIKLVVQSRNSKKKLEFKIDPVNIYISSWYMWNFFLFLIHWNVNFVIISSYRWPLFNCLSTNTAYRQKLTLPTIACSSMGKMSYHRIPLPIWSSRMAFVWTLLKPPDSIASSLLKNCIAKEINSLWSVFYCDHHLSNCFIPKSMMCQKLHTYTLIQYCYYVKNFVMIGLSLQT